MWTSKCPGPSFSGLTFSGLVTWSVIFQGLRFHALRFGPSFSGLAFSAPAFSIAPSIDIDIVWASNDCHKWMWLVKIVSLDVCDRMTCCLVYSTPSPVHLYDMFISWVNVKYLTLPWPLTFSWPTFDSELDVLGYNLQRNHSRLLSFACHVKIELWTNFFRILFIKRVRVIEYSLCCVLS